MKIKISIGKVVLAAALEETPTSKKILEALPFESKAQTWGDEVYFDAPVSSSLEKDAEQVVDPGTVCFWTEGNALALPFGPTPISQGNECRLADKCNVLGKIEGNFKTLKGVRAGDPVRVSAAD